MSTVNLKGALTLRDLAATLDPKSAVRMCIDLMHVRCDLFDDMINVQCNDGRSHVVHYRTGLPKAQWARLYGGVESSKGSYASARITCAKLKSKLELDKDELDEYPDAAGKRIQDEVEAHIDSLTLQYSKGMLYGSKRDNPDSFNGLGTIYNVCGGTNPNEIAFNCISAGGSADDSLGSLYLVGHGESGFCNLYPKGHKTAGIDVGEMHTATVHEDGKPSKTFLAQVQYFKMSGAPFVADWRKCGRICNINRLATYATKAEHEEAANAFFNKISAIKSRVKRNGVRLNWYTDQQTFELIKGYASVLTRGNAVTEKELENKQMLAIDGIPVRINDAQAVDELFVGQ